MSRIHTHNLGSGTLPGNGFGWRSLRACAAALVLPVLVAHTDVWVEREAFLMGTTFRAYVGARDADQGVAAIETAFAEVRRLDSLLSNWRDDSQIAAINRAPIGSPVHLSPELYALIAEGRDWYDRTGGAFDPGLGPLTDAWDLRGAGRHPTPAELEQARAASGLAHFTFDDGARSISRDATGAWLDAGGYGKGVALRNALATLSRAGVRSALLTFGRQVLAVGGDEQDRPWTVAIMHPSRRRTPIVTLEVRDASVSTTSQSERFVTLYGARFGHVLDPRTGGPVPPWGSVTVVSADPAEADVLSTALFVMGPDEGLAWLVDQPDIAALFLIERGGRIDTRTTPAMDGLISGR